MADKPFVPRPQKEKKDVEDPLRIYCEKRGWLYEKVQSLSRNAWPDRFLARKGRIVLCELKAPGQKPTRQQLLRHDELRRYGIEVVWFDNLEAAMEFFK